LSEFQRQVLEALREPMESAEGHISRANAQVTFPADFQLIAAMNPCQCGYFGSKNPTHHCRCTPDQVKRYRQKISGPLLDRIDLHVPVHQISHSELQKLPEGEKSHTIKQRVYAANKKQLQRQQKTNAQLSKKETNRYCIISDADCEFLTNAVDKFGLSARAYDRILKISRTIADLENKKDINRTHISEAMAFRGFNQ